LRYRGWRDDHWLRLRGWFRDDARLGECRPGPGKGCKDCRSRVERDDSLGFHLVLLLGMHEALIPKCKCQAVGAVERRRLSVGAASSRASSVRMVCIRARLHTLPMVRFERRRSLIARNSSTTPGLRGPPLRRCESATGRRRPSADSGCVGGDRNAPQPVQTATPTDAPWKSRVSTWTRWFGTGHPHATMCTARASAGHTTSSMRQLLGRIVLRPYTTMPDHPPMWRRLRPGWQRYALAG